MMNIAHAEGCWSWRIKHEDIIFGLYKTVMGISLDVWHIIDWTSCQVCVCVCVCVCGVVVVGQS